MLARQILMVALALLGPFDRLAAQYPVGPSIGLSFSGDRFTNTCSSQPAGPYSASCTLVNSAGGVMSASAEITPGGPTASVFTQASFSGAVTRNDFSDVESLASLEEEVWFTGANPDDIFSFAVSGFLHFNLFKSLPPFGTTQSFVFVQAGVVDALGNHPILGGAGYAAPDEAFNVAVNVRNPGWDPPTAFFFRLQSESIVVANCCGLDLTASSSVDPFVTFYNEAGNDITGNYTLSYNPAPFVVATPEPTTFATMLTGLLGVAGFVNRRRLSSRALRFARG